jgi:long-chain fatty acid transport protein
VALPLLDTAAANKKSENVLKNMITKNQSSVVSAKRTFFLFVALVSISTRVDAVGFRLPNQDPEGIARGNAFVATANNPSAIYYNPAGITQLKGQNVSAGLYLISASTEYESPSGAKADTDSSFQAVPQVYYTASLSNAPVSFGLGIYAPYGLAIDWGKNTSFSVLAQSGKLLYATANPVVAWQIHPTLSIGAGPTLNYSKANFKRAIGIVPGDQFKFEGDDTDYGFNAGLRWQPHEMWSFGVKYSSATKLNYDGESEASPFAPETDTHASIDFPQTVVGGISFRPNENWNFEVDVDWTDWDTLDAVVFKGTTGGPQTFTLNYRSSFMYEFGATRKFCDKWFGSLGYIYSENSSPDKNFSPLVPDSDLHLVSVGLARKGERWDWAASYTCAFNLEREVKGSVPFNLADGTYDTLNHAINFSATLKF